MVVASICRDFDSKEDISVFMEPVPARDDPWVQAEVAAVEVPEVRVARRAVPEGAPDRPADTPGPVVKGHDPP